MASMQVRQQISHVIGLTLISLILVAGCTLPPIKAPDTTRAAITYTYTGLTNMGNAINKRALQAMYAHDLKDWEEAINHYLKTGERREHH